MLPLQILLTVYLVGAALTLLLVYRHYWRSRPLSHQRYAVAARWIAALILVLLWFVTWPVAIARAIQTTLTKEP